MSEENDKIRAENLARIVKASGPMGTAERGMIAIGRAAARQPTEQEIQRGIDAAMKEVVSRDARHNPNALNPPTPVKVAGASEVVTPGEPQRGSGWAEEKPLPVYSAKGSREEALIDALVRKHVGGPNEPVR